jgi:hypothetical protein
LTHDEASNFLLLGLLQVLFILPHGVLEPFDSFADSFANFGKPLGSEEKEYNRQQNQKFGQSEFTQHKTSRCAVIKRLQTTQV